MHGVGPGTRRCRIWRAVPSGAVVVTVVLALGACTGGDHRAASADRETSSSGSHASAAPTPATTRPTDGVVANSRVVADFMADPRVRPGWVSVNGRGDILVHWSAGPFACGRPFVLTWVPPTRQAARSWYVPNSAVFEATTNGFVAPASRCRGNGRHAGPVWIIGSDGTVAAARLREHRGSDRAGHMLLACALRRGCEVDPQTKAMWPAEGRGYWIGPWDDRSSVLRRPVMSASENDWSVDEGATWHQVPETWNVDVARVDDRVALVNRRASGPVNEVNADGSTSPHGLVGGDHAGGVSWAVTPDGRLFGSVTGKNYFLLSDFAWRNLIHRRLPQGFTNAELAGQLVYATSGHKVVIGQDLGRHYERPVDLNTLKPTG